MSTILKSDWYSQYRGGSITPSGSPYLSAYVRMIYCFRREIPEISDLPQIVVANTADTPLFRIHVTSAQKLLYRINADKGRALGCDLLGGLHAKSLMVSELRYCPTCLMRGWHAAVFQHAGVRTCPVHGAQLQTGCPHCGRPIDIRCRSILLNHQYCGHCGRAIGQFEVEPTEDSSWTSKIADLHDALRPRTKEGLESSRLENDDADLILIDRAAARAMGSHCLWPERRLPFVRTFHEVVHRWPASKVIYSSLDICRASWTATIRALMQISALLQKNECQMSSPWNFIVEARCIRLRAWLPSLAYWRTIEILGAQKYIVPGRRLPDQMQPFARWWPDLPWCASYVAESQVFGLFALNLLELRKYTRLTCLPPEYIPPALSAIEPWQMHKSSSEVELVIRNRVSIEKIERLVQRYRRHQLCVQPRDGSEVSHRLTP